jgi:hypothetical protein
MGEEAMAGRCLCRDLAFEVTPPTLWCAHCHCTMCQRAHGAAFVTWVGIAEESLHLHAAETLVWYRSSESAERGFCRRCGSTLFFRSRQWPGEIHVVRANFDGAIDREPSGHVFWQSHADWVELGDDLPRRPS